MYSSNLTAKEYYALYDTLTPEQIERFLSFETEINAVSDIDANLSEAMSAYPAEDFLSEIETRLNTLKSNLRGNNREVLAGIIESLSDIAQCTFYASDYGRDELRKAIKAVEQYKNV